MANISYKAHCGGLDWLGEVSNGAIAGTVGVSVPLEAFRITGLDVPNLGIHAFAHVQDIGWSSGNILNEDVGTTGKAKHIEAVKIGLIGPEANNYDIWYRLHVRNLGWMEWSCNGAVNGTEGGNLQAEAIQIELHAKSEKFNPRVDYQAEYVNLTPQNPPQPQAPNIVDIARSYLGYLSYSEDDSAFGRRLAGANAGNWCCFYVVCCAIDAGLNIPITGSCPQIQAWAENTGRLVGDPQPGFFVLYDFGGGEYDEPNGTADHIGIVDTVYSSGHVLADEGNTGSPVGVYQKDRSSHILGYVNPF